MVFHGFSMFFNCFHGFSEVFLVLQGFSSFSRVFNVFHGFSRFWDFGRGGRLSLPLPADILFKNAIDGAMRNRWVVRGGRASVRVHGCDSEFFFRSVVDAGQPWPPDVCAASREKYTHAHAGVL